MIGRNVQRSDLHCVAKAAIGDDTSAAPDHQPRDQDITGRGRICVSSTVHHQNMARGAGFDGVTLRMLWIAKLGKLVAIFARGHVAQGEGRADHVLSLGRDRAHILDYLVAQPAFEQGGRNGRNGYMPQLVQRAFRNGHLLLSCHLHVPRILFEELGMFVVDVLDRVIKTAEMPPEDRFYICDDPGFEGLCDFFVIHQHGRDLFGSGKA